MKKIPLLFLACLLFSCDNDEVSHLASDPPYSELAGVENITAHTATFKVKLNVPVTAEGTSFYIAPGKVILEYGVFYTTDPNQGLRYWQLVAEEVKDASGLYTLTFSDFSPSTKYYVKSMVVAANDKNLMQQVPYNYSENTFEFETLPE